jgi:thiosulfate reductase cytochrome b subunit
MSSYGKHTGRIAMDKFWTMQRRAWAYSVMVALVPLLVAIGLLTGDIAQLVLNVFAAVLAVGGGSMALSNLTPDNVFKMGVQIGQTEE